MRSPLPARLDDQLCFALYAASRAVTGAYRAGLADLGLTYPQYLTLLALWERDGQTVGELGVALDLDSGTLSPLLRRLVALGYLRKERSTDDERVVRIYLAPAGTALESQVASVRRAVEDATGLDHDALARLRDTLHRLRESVSGMADGRVRAGRNGSPTPTPHH